MPHVDEFFAAPVLAAAGLAFAIAVQPAPVPTTTPQVAVPVVAPAAQATRVVRLPTIEVVARRSDVLEIARRERAPRAPEPAV